MKKHKEVAGEVAIQQSPAQTQEGRDKQMAAYAMALAEERIMNGTASNQLIIKMLDRADQQEREKLQIRKLQREIDLLEAKTQAIKSVEETERMYAEAVEAIKRYTPQWKE